MLQANNASLISIVYNNLFILLKRKFFFYYILRCIIHCSITYYELHPSYSSIYSLISLHPMPNFNFYIPLPCVPWTFRIQYATLLLSAHTTWSTFKKMSSWGRLAWNKQFTNNFVWRYQPNLSYKLIPLFYTEEFVCACYIPHTLMTSHCWLHFCILPPKVSGM